MKSNTAEAVMVRCGRMLKACFELRCREGVRVRCVDFVSGKVRCFAKILAAVSFSYSTEAHIFSP